MKKLLLCVLLVKACLLQAQVVTKALTATDLPKNLEITGKFVKGLQWNDSNGESWLILTETGLLKSRFQNADNPDIINRDARLFAYLFLRKSGIYRQRWRVTDFVEECPLDAQAVFLQEAVEVTDLDKNGIAESWLMYRTYCKADVSPSTQKLLMYEGIQKYALRGTSKIRMGTDHSGGELMPDETFKNGNKLFLDFGLAKWNRFAFEINQD